MKIGPKGPTLYVAILAATMMLFGCASMQVTPSAEKKCCIFQQDMQEEWCLEDLGAFPSDFPCDLFKEWCGYPMFDSGLSTLDDYFVFVYECRKSEDSALYLIIHWNDDSTLTVWAAVEEAGSTYTTRWYHEEAPSDFRLSIENYNNEVNTEGST